MKQIKDLDDINSLAIKIIDELDYDLTNNEYDTLFDKLQTLLSKEFEIYDYTNHM